MGGAISMGMLNLRPWVLLLCMMFILSTAAFAIYGGGQPSSPSGSSSSSSGGGGGGGSGYKDQCNDKKDNDNDGLVDYPNDPGCIGYNDNDETDLGCIENWICEPWSDCVNGVQTRECADWNACGTTVNKPLESQSCTEKVTAEEPTYQEFSKPIEEKPLPKVGTGVTGAVIQTIPQAVSSKYTIGAILLVSIMAIGAYLGMRKKKHF